MKVSMPEHLIEEMLESLERAGCSWGADNVTIRDGYAPYRSPGCCPGPLPVPRDYFTCYVCRTLSSIYKTNWYKEYEKRLEVAA